MKISFSSPAVPKSGVLVVILNGKKFDSFQEKLDKALGGQLSRILKDDSFKLDKGSVMAVPHPNGLGVSQLIVVGAPNDKKKIANDHQNLGGKIYGAFNKSQEKSATVYVPKFDGDGVTSAVASGLLLKSWRFDRYFTKKEKTDFCAIKSVEFLSDDSKKASAEFKDHEAVAEGVFLTREVVSEPPNVIYPETFAAQAKTLEKLGVKVEILGEKELKKLGCGSLLGVGQGSIRESQLVVMQWHGAKKGDAPVAFVGKGVTFDTGGISIKPAGDMDEMKWDMAGAGAVLGVIKALAGRKAKVNAVGVMGLVENMPDGAAQRPGDVVTSMSGQTIEVLNTDAEGRLVLADALWYTQDRFKPKYMIDLATLTGAIIIALGSDHAGLFSNDDKLVESLLKAGKATGEKLWHLPLSEAYDRDIDSVIADVKNIGSGRGAGSITAAQFLQRFVNKTKWAHLDIAGTAWDKKGKGVHQAGATAMGVRLLNHWVAENCE